MIQSGGGPGFATESVQGLGMAGEIVGEEFQSNKSLKPAILGLVNNPHATATQFLNNAVMRDGLSYKEILAFRRVIGKSGGVLDSNGSCGNVHCRILEKPRHHLVRPEQRTDLVFQFFIACAFTPQNGLALFGRGVQRRLQYVIDLFPSFGVHRWSGPPIPGIAMLWLPSSRASR